MTRGIVIGSRIDARGGFSMMGAVEIEDLLKWILYWDQITYAGVGLRGASIAGNQPEDVLFLEEAGVFKTKIVDLEALDLPFLPPPEHPLTVVLGEHIWGLSNTQFASAAAAARVHLSNQLSAQAGDIWTIGQAGGEHLLLPGVNERRELIDVQLVNCLPVPAVGTPFQDILEFKTRYQDEIDELRRSFDRLRENILSSSDERRAIDLAIHEISSSVSNIRAALQGTDIQTVSETIALYTNNPSIGFWTALGGMAAAAKGFPVAVGLGSGIALPTLCRFLKRSIIGGRNLPSENADFAYVYEAIKQLNL